MHRRFFKNNGKNQKIEKQSSQVRKKLCLVSSGENVEYLKLKKSTIQTVLKKQRHKRSSGVPLERKDILKFGITGSKLKIDAKFAGSTSFFLPNKEEERYSQIIRKKNCVKQIEFLSLLIPRLDFIKNLRFLPTLQSLRVNLTLEGFISFARSLEQLIRLQKLSIKIESDPGKVQPEEQELERGVSRFGQALASRKYLISFRFKTDKSFFFCNEKIEADFFGYLGETDIANFDIVLRPNPGETLKINHCEKFLQKVELLSFAKFPLFIDLPTQNKRLSFLSQPIGNPTEIISKCSSLQRLNIDGSFDHDVQNHETLRNVKEFFFQVPLLALESKLNNPKTLYQLIAQMSSLEKLKILTPWDKSSQEPLHQIHLLLSQNKNLKNYSLNIPPLGNTYVDIQTTEIFCRDIIELQSLESLTLDFHRVESYSPFDSILLPNFPKLKILNLDFRGNDTLQSFPLEKLSLLNSIEELYLGIPVTDKPVFLGKLPLLPSIRKLSVGINSFVPNQQRRITIEDYKEKFGLKTE